MKASFACRGITLLTIGAAGLFGPAAAQQQGARLYAFHTGKMGACPGLDWHITVEPDNKLVGFVAWGQRGERMARLDGQINSDRSFKMNANEVGGAGRTATVSGTAQGDYVRAMVEGSGSGCDGQMLQIPRVVGGLGGGGG
jgi:hypothetical protein